MKAKSTLLLIALTAILLTVLTQPTLAYYTTIGKTTNVVTSGNLRLQIYEKTGDGSDFPAEGVYVIPGDIVSKQVSVGNICTHPFYLRVKLTGDTTNDALSPEDSLKIDLNTNDWTYRDGFYYFNRILQPGETTPLLFSNVTVIGEKVGRTHAGTTLSLTVHAYAVQSENNPAAFPWEAAGWPAE